MKLCWLFSYQILIPEQFTVKSQEPLIPALLYKMVASMEAAIFDCQCAQMQNCEGGCETIYILRIVGLLLWSLRTRRMDIRAAV